MRFVLMLALLSTGLVLPPTASASGKNDRGRFIEVDGGRLRYETSGKGTPVVLIHGGAMDLRMWRGQMEPFSRDFRVVSYDLRGFGGSPPPQGPYWPADDLERLMQALGIDRAHIVASSLGGGVAIDFALAHPERVQSLVLVEPMLAGHRFAPEVMEAMMKVMTALQGGDEEGAVSAFLDSPALRPSKENPEVHEQIGALVQENLHGILSQQNIRFHEPDPGSRIKEIMPPTLILLGAKSGTDAREITEQLEADLPHATKRVIEDSGHMMNMEQPDVFNRLVLEFLRRVD